MNLFGFAREDITPEIGCLLYGYVDDLKSESIHDRLRLSALYFANEKEDTLMLTAEVCSINSAFSEKIRKTVSLETGIIFENIILHGIHNHTGPNTDGNTGWGELDTDYCENILLPAAVKASKNAKKGAVPAKCGFNMGESKIGINRREENADNEIILGQFAEGSFDPRMAVFSFEDENSKPLANLIFYTCHGTCAGLCKEISRDWAGGMMDKLESVSGAPTAFFCGAEGDVGPRLLNGQTVGTIRDAEIMGEKAGEDSVRIYNGIKEYRPLSVDVTHGVLSLPLKMRIPLETAEARYEEYKNESVNLDGQKRYYYKRVMDSYSNGYKDEEFYRLPQTALMIGENIFVSFPYELFSDIALRIDKEKYGFNVFSLSNSNGSEGYFPCDSEIPKGGYEIDMFLTQNIQPYCDNADSYLIKETLKNLEVFKCTE